MTKMLRRHDCWVLSPKQDIYATSTDAHGTLQKRQKKKCFPFKHQHRTLIFEGSRCDIFKLYNFICWTAIKPENKLKSVHSTRRRKKGGGKEREEVSKALPFLRVMRSLLFPIWDAQIRNVQENGQDRRWREEEMRREGRRGGKGRAEQKQRGDQL